MADIVGLRFVTTGEKEAIQAYERYKRGLLDLDQVQNKYVAAFNRRAREEMSALKRQDAEVRWAFQNQLRYQQEKERAAAQVARAVEKAAEDEARAVAKQDAETRRAYQQYLRYQQEKERAAAQAARVLEQTAAREARAAEQAAAREARAQQEVVQSYQRLRASVDPTYAAKMRLRQAHEQVRQALAREIITREEAARTLTAYRAQAQQTTTAMQGQAAASMFASRAQNATGMALQQTGYQVGDFLVQVQSGTNWMVAFGQQATQLVGILPMFGSVMGISGTALIGLATTLGIAIPLVTAVGAAFMRAGGQAESATSDIRSIAESLNMLEQIRLDNLNESLIEGARGAAREYERVLALMERVETRALRAALRGQTEPVEQAIAGQMTRQSLAGRLGETFDFDVLGLDSLERALFLATQLRTLNGETREELAQQVVSIEQAVALRGAMTPQVEALLAKLAEEVGLLDSVAEAVQAVSDGTAETQRALEEQIKLEQRLAEEARRRNQAHQERVQDIESENRVLQLTVRYGKDSAEVQREINLQARARLVTEMMAEGQTAQNIATALRLLRTQQDLTAEAEATTDAVAGIGPALQSALNQANAFAAAMGRARAESAGIGVSTAGLQAQAAALEGGASRAEATATGAAATLREQLLAQAGGAGRGTGARIEQQVAERFDQVLQRELASERVSALSRTSGGGSGGGGGGAGAAQEDYLQNLLLEAERKREMVGLSEEQVRRQEILLELEKRGLPLTDARIEQIVRTEAETQRLLDAESRRLDIVQTVENNIDNAFMAMVEGSASVEDAFRSMLRNILSEVYKQQVVQPISSGVSGLLGGLLGINTQADGGAFNGGVEFFANGGVVGAPTMFRHASGLGVMGEAGPEAIMPLKRGKDGKLGVAAGGGGSSAAPVQVVYNFQGGVTEADLGRALPLLVERTKREVIDAVQRGGSVARVFS